MRIDEPCCCCPAEEVLSGFDSTAIWPSPNAPKPTPAAHASTQKLEKRLQAAEANRVRLEARLAEEVKARKELEERLKVRSPDSGPFFVSCW